LSKAGITENASSYNLRKTWGYHQRMDRQALIPVMMVAFGHSSETLTLEYLGIQANEVQVLYSGLALYNKQEQ
jgi:hypothetical protein